MLLISLSTLSIADELLAIFVNSQTKLLTNTFYKIKFSEMILNIYELFKIIDD